MPIDQIWPGNLCGRKAQVPGGEMSSSANGRAKPLESSLETWLTLSILGIGDLGRISSAEGIRAACNRSIYCLVDLGTLESSQYLGCAQRARRLLLMFEVGEDLALGRPPP